MAKNPGIIYDLGNKRYGIAYQKEQHENFLQFNKIYLHVFVDAECTKPEIDPKNGKKVVTLKNIITVKQIGFVD